MKMVALAAALLAASPAGAVSLRAPVDCGQWVAERSKKQADWSEFYLVGFMNGLAIGTNVEFWQAGGKTISAEAVYLWMDNHCKANPFRQVEEAAALLFEGRSS